MDPSSRFPAEIWLKAWDSCSTRDIGNLVLVCRHFRDICQPLLFQRQRLTTPEAGSVFSFNWITTTRRLHRSHMRLQKLAASSHVSSVRAWVFYGTLDKFSGVPAVHPNILHIHLIPETYAKLVELFCTTLGLYQNLQSLRLSGLVVDSAFRHTLASLGRLEELVMVECSILGRTGPLLPLRHLTLTMLSRTSDHTANQLEPLHIVSPETLRSLTIDSSHDARAFLSTHANDTFDNLFSLKIKLSDIAAERALAFSFLEHCPRVAHIEISRPSTLFGTLPPHLPPSAILNLHSFKGPLSLGGLITSNRPVSVVEFSGDVHRKEDVLKGLAALSNTSVPLRALSLNLRINTMVDIAAAITLHFPELRKLSVALLSPNTNWTAAPDVFADFDPGWVPVSVGFHMDDDERRYRDFNRDESSVDERTVDLSDTDTLDGWEPPATVPRKSYTSVAKFVSQRAERKALLLNPTDVTRAVVALPDVLLPGHMYNLWGESFAPPAEPEATRNSPVVQVQLIESICAARVSFPPKLGTLRLLLRGPGGVNRVLARSARAVDHRVVLALEAQLPMLHEVEFPDVIEESSLWTREGSVWTHLSSRTVIVSRGTNAAGAWTGSNEGVRGGSIIFSHWPDV
ncbi:hypothetical protein C8R44DRAFT_752287 [Mycena epipterygia]|nr:hypothetical protein C8R44DRAFT_752287 [Mycena epipterygia]